MIKFANNMKTAILLAGLMGLFLYIGSFWGQRGMIIALMLGGCMNVVAYFFSDKIAIMSMHGQEVTEVSHPQLVGMVRELAQRANLPMPKVYICPQQTPNAFATGRNPHHAAVAVTQGILQILNENELRGVIGHELGHVKNRDILISTVAATIAGAISMLGYMLYFVPIGGHDNRRGNPLAAIALIILAPIAAALIQMAISRKREFVADNYGAELCGDPMYLASALSKLHQCAKQMPMNVPIDSQKNMFIVEPFTGKDAANLFNTHPTLKKRLKALIGRERL